MKSLVGWGVGEGGGKGAEIQPVWLVSYVRCFRPWCV